MPVFVYYGFLFPHEYSGEGRFVLYPIRTTSFVSIVLYLMQNAKIIELAIVGPEAPYYVSQINATYSSFIELYSPAIRCNQDWVAQTSIKFRYKFKLN